MSTDQWTCHGCSTSNGPNDARCVVCGSEPGAHEAQITERYEPPAAAAKTTTPKTTTPKTTTPKTTTPKTTTPKTTTPTTATPTTRAPRTSGTSTTRTRPAPPTSTPSASPTGRRRPRSTTSHRSTPTHTGPPLTVGQRRHPARLARAGFFLTLVCCPPVGVVLAILGHRQMRKHPEVHQARGWAWATYLLAFAMVAIVGVAFAAINRETAAFEGRWSTGSGDVLVELDQTDLGTQLEGGFVLDAGTCTGQFIDGQLSDGAWEAEAVGTCTGDVPLEQSVTLRIVDGRLTGFGDEPLERRPS